jgi:S-adenosylmethionine:tRNA ribosyltransferase-isomerase
MRLELLDYSLPEQAIAQHPSIERDGARLLRVEARGVEHHRFKQWAEMVPAGALVVLNDTRVRRSRLWCTKSTGGGVEVLFLHARPASGGTQVWTVLAQANRPLRLGMHLTLGSARLTVAGRLPGGELELVVTGHGDLEAFFEAHGQVPLPPYIRRDADQADTERYQTVFAQHLGSAAAPTAGLHLTPAILQALEARGVSVGYVTLHVGAGTFLPVRCADLDDHPMHAEPFAVSQDLAALVARARARGGPVVAVGTTVVRALESAHDVARPGHVRACSEATRLLIQPGHPFRVVDALLTNFHAPKSTLLALVSAFVGQRRCAAAYRTALGAGYRFLSYGDAMWLPERFAEDVGAGDEAPWRLDA